MNILHLSDLHFNHKHYFNATSISLAQCARNAIGSQDIDALVISGDLFSTGPDADKAKPVRRVSCPGELRAMNSTQIETSLRRQLGTVTSGAIARDISRIVSAVSATAESANALLNELGFRDEMSRTERVLIVPGNHDVLWVRSGTGAATKKSSEDRDFAPNLAAFDTLMEAIYCGHCKSTLHPLVLQCPREHPEVVIVGLDSNAVSDKSFQKLGRVDAGVLAAVGAKLESLPHRSDGLALPCIAVLHHHLVPIVAMLQDKASVTVNAMEIVRDLAAAGVRAVLHGHQHAPTILSLSSHEPVVSEASVANDTSERDMVIAAAGTAGKTVECGADPAEERDEPNFRHFFLHEIHGNVLTINSFTHSDKDKCFLREPRSRHVPIGNRAIGIGRAGRHRFRDSTGAAFDFDELAELWIPLVSSGQDIALIPSAPASISDTWLYSDAEQQLAMELASVLQHFGVQLQLARTRELTFVEATSRSYLDPKEAEATALAFAHHHLSWLRTQCAAAGKSRDVVIAERKIEVLPHDAMPEFLRLIGKASVICREAVQSQLANRNVIVLGSDIYNAVTREFLSAGLLKRLEKAGVRLTIAQDDHRIVLEGETQERRSDPHEPPMYDHGVVIRTRNPFSPQYWAMVAFGWKAPGTYASLCLEFQPTMTAVLRNHGIRADDEFVVVFNCCCVYRQRGAWNDNIAHVAYPYAARLEPTVGSGSFCAPSNCHGEA